MYMDMPAYVHGYTNVNPTQYTNTDIGIYERIHTEYTHMYRDVFVSTNTHTHICIYVSHICRRVGILCMDAPVCSYVCASAMV
jgi:hypothetical protein